MNKPEIFIEKEKLTPNPLNHFPIGDLTDLKNTIEQFGILSPISVIGPYDDGSYRIISGHRRYTSWCELCEEGRVNGKVPYYIVGDKDMPEREQYIRILISNIEAREENTSNIYKAELLEVIKQMAEEGEIREKAISGKMAEYMKTSTRYARYWTRVFGSDNEELKELVKDNKLSIKNADKIISMDEEEQAEAIRAVKNGVKIPSALLHSTAGREKDNATEPLNPTVALSDNEDENSKNEKTVPATFGDLIKGGNFTKEDLDQIDFSLDDMIHDPDINLTSDTTGRVGELFSDDSCDMPRSSNARDREAAEMIQTVISWCSYIKTVTDPTSEEWNAINQCIEVAERFG